MKSISRAVVQVTDFYEMLNEIKRKIKMQQSEISYCDTKQTD